MVMASCHSDRLHHARGLCKQCYDEERDYWRRSADDSPAKELLARRDEDHYRAQYERAVNNSGMVHPEEYVSSWRARY